MLKYTVKRILLVIPILFGVIFIVFSIMSLTPGDPGRLMLGINAKQEAVDALNHQLGYDQPFFVRLFKYTGDLLHGDLGTSYRTTTSFTDDLLVRLPVTFRVGFISMIISGIIGISLGILAAIKQFTVWDSFTSAMALIFASVPSFFIGLAMVLYFGVHLHWLPTTGVSDWTGYIMPIITLTLGSVASIMRFTRTAMLEAVNQDYIRTARAKGCTEKKVIWKHAFKNALIPIITLLGTHFGTILGGSIIVENVFNLPGIGQYVLTAIRSKDIPIVLSSTVVLAAFFCVVMIVVDLLYAAVDPRVRERYHK